MSEKSHNLPLKYAVIGFFGCLIGVYISQTLGYNDGSLQAYMTGGVAGLIGGAVGGLARQRKGENE